MFSITPLILGNTAFTLSPVSRFCPNRVRAEIEDIDDATVVPAPDGDVALFEFTGALPRAKLYATWRSVTNSDAALAQIVSDAFDPGDR